MNQVMMEGAEYDQVLKAGFPAVQPVLDVVPVKKGRVGAPGKAQPWSRSIKARRMAGGIPRARRPMFSASPSPPVARRPQSQATRCSVSAETRLPSSTFSRRWPGPYPRRHASQCAQEIAPCSCQPRGLIEASDAIEQTMRGCIEVHGQACNLLTQFRDSLHDLHYTSV